VIWTARLPTGACRWAHHPDHEVGIDVPSRWPTACANALPGDLAAVAGLLRQGAGSGRLGTKNGKGFYLVEGRAEGTGPPSTRYWASIPGQHPDAWLIGRSHVLPMVTRPRAAWMIKFSKTASELERALFFFTCFRPFRGGLFARVGVPCMSC